MDGVPAFGYSPEKISFLISLNDDGTVSEIIDCRDIEGKRVKPREMMVPQAVKRTAGVAPNFLWDKTSYVLGINAPKTSPSDNQPTDEEIAQIEKDASRDAAQHLAFVEYHAAALAEADDLGLGALKAFLESWKPELFNELSWPEEMKGANVAFVLASDRTYIHDRPAAKSLWARVSATEGVELRRCLVTGELAPIRRLHPSIKNVRGAKSTGASLVSYNDTAYGSYGKKQGDNAPVSERASFAYGAALNRMLQNDSGHRIQIGDASTVFWADASSRSIASETEALFSLMFDSKEAAKTTEKVDTARLENTLSRIRDGVVLEDVDPALTEGVKFNILGLAPNSARVSVRFHYCDTFGELARNYQRFVSDMRVDPSPKGGYPAMWRYLRETAVLGKSENVIPTLSGEWMRSILTGENYPLSLLSSVLIRIRADGDINPLRVSMLKAVLVRNYGKDTTPVSLDRTHTNKGYLLGRLFAVYERIQSAALGRNLNATIKEKFYSSASAQPRRIFGVLADGASKHLSKVGKSMPGYRVVLERELGSITEMMSPGDNPYPVFLSTDEQALFALGYYHQRSDFFNTTATPVNEGE
jgi:CRISPR-associated protein Csd1